MELGFPGVGVGGGGWAGNLGPRAAHFEHLAPWFWGLRRLILRSVRSVSDVADDVAVGQWLFQGR